MTNRISVDCQVRFSFLIYRCIKTTIISINAAQDDHYILEKHNHCHSASYYFSNRLDHFFHS